MEFEVVSVRSVGDRVRVPPRATVREREESRDDRNAGHLRVVGRVPVEVGSYDGIFRERLALRNIVLVVGGCEVGGRTERDSVRASASEAQVH